MAKAAKNKKAKAAAKETTATDTRGHEVKMYKHKGVWYVERNNNGSIHPVACVNGAEAADLFKEYCAE